MKARLLSKGSLLDASLVGWARYLLQGLTNGYSDYQI